MMARALRAWRRWRDRDRSPPVVTVGDAALIGLCVFVLLLLLAGVLS